MKLNGRPLLGHVYRRHLTRGVYTRIGSAGADYRAWRIRQATEAGLEFALNGPEVGLVLPPVEPGAVVVDDELEADILGFQDGKVETGVWMSSEGRLDEKPRRD